MRNELEKKYKIYYSTPEPHNMEIMGMMLEGGDEFLRRLGLDKYILVLEVYSHVERITCVFKKDPKNPLNRGEHFMLCSGIGVGDILIRTKDTKYMSIFDKTVPKEKFLKECVLDKS